MFAISVGGFGFEPRSDGELAASLEKSNVNSVCVLIQVWKFTKELSGPRNLVDIASHMTTPDVVSPRDKDLDSCSYSSTCHARKGFCSMAFLSVSP